MSLPAGAVYKGRRVLFKYHKFRSGSGLHPPNSLTALEETLQGGAAAVEFDVGLLADGGFALLHDARLERETTGYGRLRATASSDLAALRLRGSNEPPPTLSQLVRRLSQHSDALKVQVDLKEAEPLSVDVGRRLLEALAPLQSASQIRVIVGCLADWNLRLLRRLAPDLLVGFDPSFYLYAPTPDPMPLPTRVNAYGYVDDHPLGFRRAMPVARYLEDRLECLLGQVPGTAEVYLHKGFVARALQDGVNPIDFVHRAAPGVLVDVWTLNEDDADLERDLEAALSAGADQLTTDTALQLADRLAAAAGAP